MLVFRILFLFIFIYSCRKENQELLGNDTHPKTFWSASKSTLAPAVREEKFYKLFTGYQKNFPFEGSGVHARGNQIYVVFDNMKAIGVMEASFENAKGNFLKGNVYEKSNYEAIAFKDIDPIGFYVMIESKEKDNGYYPFIVRLDSELNFQEEKIVKFELDKKNKGLEGISYVRRNEEDFFLGLCEGNFCNSDKEKHKGNGRILVMKESEDHWKVVAEIKLSPNIPFLDYSDMDIENGRVAIVSQASSAIWIGELHPERWELSEKGSIYYFPFGDREGNAGLGGEVIYCNIEGVSWLGHHEVVVASDKRSEEQDKWCKHKESMIHIFEIPNH